jgi:hypothetical protein
MPEHHGGPTLMPQHRRCARARCHVPHAAVCELTSPSPLWAASDLPRSPKPNSTKPGLAPFRPWLSLQPNITRLFGLSNELVHHLLSSYFFVWFTKWNGLIHHHLIFHKLVASTCVTNEVIPSNIWNGLMMHHLI